MRTDYLHYIYVYFEPTRAGEITSSAPSSGMSVEGQYPCPDLDPVFEDHGATHLKDACTIWDM